MKHVLLVLILTTSWICSFSQNDSLRVNEIGVSVVYPIAIIIPSYEMRFPYYSLNYKRGNLHLTNIYGIEATLGYYDKYIGHLDGSVFTIDSIQGRSDYHTTDSTKVRVSQSGNSYNISLRFGIHWRKPRKYVTHFHGFEIGTGITPAWKTNRIYLKELLDSGDWTYPRDNIERYHQETLIWNLSIGYIYGLMFHVSENIFLTTHIGVEYLTFYGKEIRQNANYSLYYRNLTSDSFKFIFLTDISIYYRF